MRIVAAIPTYNRPDYLIKNIQSLLSQTYPVDSIVIVDNASNLETKEILMKNGFLKHEKINYIRLDVNEGASGGFKKAMEVALMHESADWIWGMDDDAFPLPNALEVIVKNLGGNDAECFWCNCDEDENFESETKEVDKMIFVGFFVSSNLVNSIGFPDKEFYMYHDDTDYSFRIRKFGYKIVKIRDAIIEHKGFDKRGKNPILRRKFLGLNVNILNCERYRIYYIYRNCFYINKYKSFGTFRYLIFWLFGVLKYLFFRREVVLAVFLSGVHVLKGKRGKVDLPDTFY